MQVVQSLTNILQESMKVIILYHGYVDVDDGCVLVERKFSEKLLSLLYELTGKCATQSEWLN